MAIGTYSSFQVFVDQVQAGFSEVLQQQADYFNARSRGAISMIQDLREGHWIEETFFKSMPGLITRRDITANPATPVTDLNLTQDLNILVKVNRKIGPAAMTLDAWRKINREPGEFSVVLGRQAAPAAAIDMLNTGLRAAVAALSGTASLVVNITLQSPSDTVNTDALIQTLWKAGDSAGGIRCWAMHSTAYARLLRTQATTHTFDAVAGVNIAEGTAVTLGIPVLITDSPALHANVSPVDPVKVLGLREGAIRLIDSQVHDMIVDPITGGEQLASRIQGEYAYNVGVLGYKWDTAAGINPTDATIGTSGSWDQVVSDVKNAAGVIMIADPV